MTWVRRTAFWLGTILISLSWRVSLHLVTAPATALGLLVTLAGISCVAVAVLTGPPRAWRRTCVALFVAAGAVFLISGISTGLLLRVAPGLHDIDLPARLAPLVEKVSARFGLAGGMLTFWDGKKLETVRFTFEGLGLYEVWFIIAGAGTVALLLGAGVRVAGLIRAIGVIAGYALLRFILVAAFAVEFGRPDLLWQPAVGVASYLPLGFLMAGVSGVIPAEPGVSRRRLIAAGAIAIALLAGTILPWAASRVYTAAGETGRARVLIDESHSDWEWAGEPFDTTSFGIRAEYNYYCFARYLGEFFEMSVAADSVTPERLGDCDVLIVKTPTEAYGAGEIDAIVEFVNQGGSLFLIGDHTNLFGMTTHLNAIGERFGLRFRSDDTFDLATGGFSSHVPMGFWTHPAMRGVRGFRFLTSCTIEGGPGIEPIMLGVGLGSEDCDYGHPNFFGNISYGLADRFGVFLQAAARRYGRGRVLLFTDSTCFSNFCMFSPGTPEAALGFLKYLAVGGTGEAAACRKGASPVVVVDTTHSRASFFDYIGYSGRPVWERFEEFYISIARAGMRPVAGGISDLESADPKGLVLVNPRGPFAPGEVERMFEFVRDGGGLLILDSVANSTSVANELLRVFNMKIVTAPIAEPGLIPRLEILGGEAVASDSGGRAGVARTTCGAGTVVVAVDSYAYSEAGLGRPLQHTHVYAGSESRYRSLFDLFEGLR